jgi:hypothetical protein
MAAEAITGRFRPASATSGRVALVAAGVTVAMFGACGVHRGALPFGSVAVMLESAEFGIAVLAALTVLLFPDGRSQRLRSRWLLWIFLAASAMFTATLAAGQALGPLGWTADGLILVCWAIIIGRQVAGTGGRPGISGSSSSG